jgi:hypothetical protein
MNMDKETHNADTFNETAVGLQGYSLDKQSIETDVAMQTLLCTDRRRARCTCYRYENNDDAWSCVHAACMCDFQIVEREVTE